MRIVSYAAFGSPDTRERWEFFQSSADRAGGQVAGLSYVILWEGGRGELARYAAETRDKLHDMHESGNRSWGKPGVAIGQMTFREQDISVINMTTRWLS